MVAAFGAGDIVRADVAARERTARFVASSAQPMAMAAL